MGKSRNTMPCRINGQHFASHIEAARALNVCHSAISQAIREGREDNVLRYQGKLGNSNGGKPIRLGRHEWPSKAHAARALGMSRHALSRAVKPTASNAQREGLMLALMKFDLKAGVQ